MPPLKASEISSFLFCKRAWYYQRKGIKSQNQRDLVTGTRLHHAHGRQVLRSGLLKFFAYGLLLVSLILFVIYFTNQLF